MGKTFLRNRSAMRLVAFCLLCLAGLALPAAIPHAAATPLDKEIRFAYPTEGYPPYLIAKNDGSVDGILVDIFGGIARQAGYTVRFIRYPERRALILIARGDVDAWPSAKEWQTDRDNYDWTDPIFEVADHVVSRREAPLDITSLADLHGHRVGAMSEFYYPSFNDAFEKNLIHRSNATKTRNLLLMLNSGRVDAVILDRHVALWLMNTSPDIQPGDFYIADKDFDPVGYRIMMSRTNPLDWSSFITAYNAILAKWKKKGRIGEVINRYDNPNQAARQD